MIREHDRVVLTAPLHEEGLEAGDIGAVVHIYPQVEAYQVEFVTLTRQTAAVITVPATQLRPVGSHEIPHARELVNGRTKSLQAKAAAPFIPDGVGDSLHPGSVVAQLPAAVPDLWRSPQELHLWLAYCPL